MMKKILSAKSLLSAATALMLLLTVVLSAALGAAAEMSPIEKINHYGGFENGISADMSAANECVFRFFKCTTVLSQEPVHSGANAAKVVPTEDGAFFLFDVELEQGAKYDFSAYVYSAEGFNNGRIEISKDGVNKEKIANVTVAAGEWTKVKHSFTAAEAGKYRLAFTGFAKKNTVYYFDDIRFSKSAEMSPIEKINHYGGFENGISADMSAANECVFRFFKFDAALSTEKKNSGEHSIKVVPTSDDSFFLFDLELDANTFYKFSIYVYSDEGIEDGRIELSYNWQQQSALAASVTTDPEKWTRIDYTLKAEKQGQYRLALKGFAKGKTYFVDDIALENIISASPMERINFYGGFENGMGSLAEDKADPQVFRFYQYTTELSAEKVYAGNYSLKASPNVNEGFFLFDIQLEENTDYTFQTYVYTERELNNVRIELRLGSDLVGSLQNIPVETEQWNRIQYTFKTSAAGQYRLALKGFVKDNDYYFDDISFKKGTGDGGDAPAVSDAYLTSFNPKAIFVADGTNLLQGADMENIDNTPLTEETFLKPGVLERVSSSPVGRDGYALHFTPQSDTREIRYFKITLEPQTEYMLSFLVKGEYISDTNKADMSFGIMNSNLQYLELKNKKAGSSIYYDETPNCTKLKSLTPPSWDGSWYRRGCTFNTGTGTEFCIAISGKRSDAWIDDIQLCKAGSATQYQSKRNYSVKLTSLSTDKTYCKDEYNLVENGTISDLTGAFWNTGTTVGKIGSSIAFEPIDANTNAIVSQKQFAVPTNAYYIKWITVEPHTTYTMSVRMRTDGERTVCGIAEDDGGYFSSVSAWCAAEENRWSYYGSTFDSGENTKIGFYITDSANRTEVTDIRLFKSEHGETQKPVDTAQNETTNENSHPATDTKGSTEDDGSGDSDSEPTTPGKGSKKQTVKKIVKVPVESDYGWVVWVIVGVGAAALIAGAILLILGKKGILFAKRKRQKDKA